MAKAKRGRPTNYERCVKLIIEANELIVDDKEDKADKLLDKIGEIRPKLPEFESAVIGRLLHSLWVSDRGMTVEIDEASGGSLDYDQ